MIFDGEGMAGKGREFCTRNSIEKKKKANESKLHDNVNRHRERYFSLMVVGFGGIGRRTNIVYQLYYTAHRTQLIWLCSPEHTNEWALPRELIRWIVFVGSGKRTKNKTTELIICKLINYIKTAVENYYCLINRFGWLRINIHERYFLPPSTDSRVAKEMVVDTLQSISATYHIPVWESIECLGSSEMNM